MMTWLTRLPVWAQHLIVAGVPVVLAVVVADVVPGLSPQWAGVVGLLLAAVGAAVTPGTGWGLWPGTGGHPGDQQASRGAHSASGPVIPPEAPGAGPAKAAPEPPERP